MVNSALTLPKSTDAFKLASQIRTGAINADASTIGRLYTAYTEAGGSMTFMTMPDVETQNGEILVPELPEIGTAGSIDYTQMTPAQIEQGVQESIQTNAQNNPKGLQKAMIEGVMALENIKARMQRQSWNINYQGIDTSRAHNAYVSYFFEGGGLNTSAQEIAAGIRDVIATGKLKAADVEKLSDAVAEMVGDAQLAEAYVAGNMDGNREGGYNQSNSGDGVTEYLPDIEIYKSVGAKANNYDILTPNGEILNLTEGTFIRKVEVIAGRRKNRKIDMVDDLIYKYGGDESKWIKCKGFGYIDVYGESLLAELHWYEEPSVGRVDFKIKPQPGGELFVYED